MSLTTGSSRSATPMHARRPASRPPRGSPPRERSTPGLIELHNHLSYNALPALAAGQGLQEPRPVGRHRAVPEVRQRPDDGPRQDPRAPAGGRPLRRVQVPRGGRHDLAGDRALQQQRDPEVLPRQHPKRRGHARGRSRGRPDQDQRRRGDQGRGLPDAPQEDPQADPPPGRGSRPDRPGALRGAPPGRWHLGARTVPGRDPRQRTRRRRLRRPPRPRRRDRLVAAQQSAALRRDDEGIAPPRRRA